MESAFRTGLTPDDQLIETFGWWPGEGFRRLDAHLTRMKGSAAALGFKFDERAARAVLQAGGDTPLRCRLTLGRNGFSFSSAGLGTTPDMWRLGVALGRLRSSDALLRHKTTRRDVYDAARAEMGTEYDEMILLNENGEVCEGSITNLFVVTQDGRQVTPALDCGLLPGVLRSEMLARGWVEKVLTVDDLTRARTLAVGNSLRGICDARLVL